VAGNASDYNITQAEQQLQSTPPGTFPFDGPRNGQFPPLDPRTTEDCLFLDVVVPKSTFDQASNGTGEKGKGAPVLAWWVFLQISQH
jgi:carboxylesterase type B